MPQVRATRTVACGDRRREVECICGAWVLCPDVDDLSGVRVHASESVDGLVARVQAPAMRTAWTTKVIQMEKSPAEAERKRVHRLGRDGPSGLTTACGRVILWFAVSLLGFAADHALYLQTLPYIVSAAIVAPVSPVCGGLSASGCSGARLLDGAALVEGREQLRMGSP